MRKFSMCLGKKRMSSSQLFSEVFSPRWDVGEINFINWQHFQQILYYIFSINKSKLKMFQLSRQKVKDNDFPAICQKLTKNIANGNLFWRSFWHKGRENMGSQKGKIVVEDPLSTTRWRLASRQLYRLRSKKTVLLGSNFNVTWPWSVCKLLAKGI